jgi:hypothetical protein
LPDFGVAAETEGVDLDKHRSVLATLIARDNLSLITLTALTGELFVDYQSFSEQRLRLKLR